MKILILVKSIDGGTGTFIEHLLKINKLYTTKKPEIRILALEEPTYRKLNHEVSFVHSKNYYAKKYSLSLRSITSFVKECIVVAQAINIFRPQVILSVDIHCNILVLIDKILSHRTIKVIATTHIHLSETLRHKASASLRILLCRTISRLYDRADILVAVSNGVKNDLISYFYVKKKINIIYNGISLGITQKSHSANENNRILSIGRLVPQKDFTTLIKAFSYLSLDIPDATLAIVGDGTQKDELVSLVHKMKLQNRIIFRGWQNERSHDLNYADVFVLSSLREGFPYALLEAMTAGMPVISTDAPYGPREILLNNKYGRIIPVGNAQEMASAMKMLLEDKKKYAYYAERALERASHFSLDNMLKKYKKVIEKINGT